MESLVWCWTYSIFIKYLMAWIHDQILKKLFKQLSFQLYNFQSYPLSKKKKKGVGENKLTSIAWLLYVRLKFHICKQERMYPYGERIYKGRIWNLLLSICGSTYHVNNIISLSRKGTFKERLKLLFLSENNLS